MSATFGRQVVLVDKVYTSRLQVNGWRSSESYIVVKPKHVYKIQDVELISGGANDPYFLSLIWLFWNLIVAFCVFSL